MFFVKFMLKCKNVLKCKKEIFNLNQLETWLLLLIDIQDTSYLVNKVQWRRMEAIELKQRVDRFV